MAPADYACRIKATPSRASLHPVWRSSTTRPAMTRLVKNSSRSRQQSYMPPDKILSVSSQRTQSKRANRLYLQNVATLTTFFLAMTLYPEAQKRAQAEIDAVIGSERLPTFVDKDQLPYVHAVIQEVLRWIPVFPLGESCVQGFTNKRLAPESHLDRSCSPSCYKRGSV